MASQFSKGLAVFDKKTRDVIEADIVKMKSKGAQNFGFSSQNSRQEKEVKADGKEEEKPIDPEDFYFKLAEKLKKQPLKIGQESYNHPTLTKLMAIPKRDDYSTGEEDSESGDENKDSDGNSENSGNSSESGDVDSEEDSEVVAVMKKTQRPNHHLQDPIDYRKIVAAILISVFFYAILIHVYSKNLLTGII